MAGWCTVPPVSPPPPTSAVIQVKSGCRLRSVGEPGLSRRSVVPSGRVAVVSQGMWLCPNTRTSTAGNAAAHRRSRPVAAPVSWTTANRTPPRSTRATSGSRAAARARRCSRGPPPAVRSAPEGVEQVDGDPVARVHDHICRVDRRPEGFRQVAGGAAGGCPRSGRAVGTPALAHAQQVDDEHQRLARLRSRRPRRVSPKQVRRITSLRRPPTFMPRHALVPAADHPAGPEREAERRTAVPGRANSSPVECATPT